MFKRKFQWLRCGHTFTVADLVKDSRKPLMFVIPLLVCCLVIYGANSVRGTDQFWYLADVETLIDGSPPVSNVFFPGTLLRGEVGPDRPNYIYHNGPMLYLSAMAGEYIGAYRAWILINLVCHFLVAFAVYLGARALTNNSIAFATAAFYLVSPLAVWQAMSMLLEQYLAGVMALVVIGFLYRKSIAGKGLFIFGVALGAVSHPMFTCIGLAAGILFTLVGAKRSNVYMVVAGLTGAIGTLYLGNAASDIFPTGFFPKLSIAIANVLPDRESMYWYFTEHGYAIQLHVLMMKLVDGLYQQFFSLHQLPFNFFTNVALLVWVYLLVTKGRQYAGLLIASGIVLCLYLAQVVLMQHQVRYQHLVAPVVFIVIALGVHSLPVVFRNRVVVAGALLCVTGLSVYLSHMSHQKADHQRVAMAQQAAGLAFLKPDANIVAYDCKCDQKLSYILKPHPVLNIKSRYLSESAHSRVLALFKPDYFVSSRAALESTFSFLSPVKSVNDSLHGNLYWYAVDYRQREDSIRITDVDSFM